jgi:hypothetical protein
MAHGVPSAAELAEAVQAFLRTEVVPATEGRTSFLARVAANVVAILEREAALGPAHAAAHAERLAALGVRDDAELCDAIRAGRLDARADELLELLRADAVEKVRIANPRWLTPADAE